MGIVSHQQIGVHWQSGVINPDRNSAIWPMGSLKHPDSTRFPRLMGSRLSSRVMATNQFSGHDGDLTQ